MIEEVVTRVVQHLLRHAEGASQGVYGVLMWGMWMLSRSNARLLKNDTTKHQGYVRVVMCSNQRYGEHVWPQTWLSGMI